MAPKLARVSSQNAGIKTYQYLRIGMVGIVGLLGVSLWIEIDKTDCLQHSISAYYFTPVRTIFVGSLMAIGAALIFISGRTLVEDTLLSIAGMFAPVVAVIPTTDVGECWSTEPPAQPVIDGQLAPWVVAGVRNNVKALLIMGFLGLAAIAVLALIRGRDNPRAIIQSTAWSTWAALAIILAVLILGVWAYNEWDGFFDHAHSYAAIAMFGFLALAVALNAWDLRTTRPWPFYAYVLIAIAMPVTALVVWLIDDWAHAVFVLEAIEIGLFLAFWAVQTVRLWDGTVTPRPAPDSDLAEAQAA